METLISNEINNIQLILEYILDSISDPIFVKERDHRLVYANDAGCRLLVRSREDIIGKTDHDLFPGEQADIFRHRDDLVLQTGKEAVNEESISDAGGRLHLFNIKRTRIIDNKGNIYILTVMHERIGSENAEAEFLETRNELTHRVAERTEDLARANKQLKEDISERKRLEKVRREGEERYHIIVDTANEGIWMQDNNYRTTFVNDKMADMLGCVKEEMIGQPFDAFLFPEDIPAHHQRMEKRRQGLPGRYELRFRCKDGRVVWTLVSAAPVLDKKNHFNGSFAMFTDITERKRIEEELRITNQKLYDIIEFLPDATFVIDTEKKVIAWNKAIEEMTGVKKNDILGKGNYAYSVPFYGRTRPILVDLIGVDHNKVEEEYDFIKNEGNTLIGQIYVPSLYHGKGAYIAVVASPLLDSQGNRVGAIESVRDVTELKRAQESLNESYRKIEKTIRGIIEAIIKIVETRDPYTAGHEQHVARLAVAIAKEMGFSREQLNGLEVAATLHDIGKIYVPTEILTKPGTLNNIEFQIIKTHAEASYDILKRIDFPWPVAQIAYQHQERHNGSGYPRGLSGRQILLAARILAVADVVEAMTFARPYRSGAGLEKALKEIEKNKGILYDPDVAEICLKLFREKGFRLEEIENNSFVSSS